MSRKITGLNLALTSQLEELCFSVQSIYIEWRYFDHWSCGFAPQTKKKKSIWRLFSSCTSFGFISDAFVLGASKMCRLPLWQKCFKDKLKMGILSNVTFAACVWQDFEFHQGKSEYEDVLQSNNMASSATPRGHQTPSAFLILASGLDKVNVCLHVLGGRYNYRYWRTIIGCNVTLSIFVHLTF
jgi:hypothetical protein